MAGNRTRVNCLEGSYAHHYTTDASESSRHFKWLQLKLWQRLVWSLHCIKFRAEDSVAQW